MKVTTILRMLPWALWLLACDSTSPETRQWYSTCGDPVCRGYDGPWNGVAACDEIEAGAPCEVAGQTCDFMSDCNARLVCASEDPKLQAGGCPISRARFKRDINYLAPAERDRYYRELLELRLATYRYRGRSDQKLQLGIVLEDAPDGIWADPANDRVDLYGYTSLAVAGVQTQASELAALQAELGTLRAELAALRSRVESQPCPR